MRLGFYSPKGGSGTTTIVASLGAAFAAQGRDTRMECGDRAGSLFHAFGVDQEAAKETVELAPGLELGRTPSTTNSGLTLVDLHSNSTTGALSGADAVVVVTTPHPLDLCQLADAIEQVGASKARLLGILVNRVPSDRGGLVRLADLRRSIGRESLFECTLPELPSIPEAHANGLAPHEFEASFDGARHTFNRLAAELIDRMERAQ